MKCPDERIYIGKCNKCQKEYSMPYIYCCLTECGEHEFCQNCKVRKGINNNDDQE
jgi:hypothetical protein